MSAVATSISNFRPRLHPQLHAVSHTADVPVLVSLVRLHDRRHERDRFVCDGNAWNLLLDVAVAFGWKQRGTTYLPNSFSTANAGAPSRLMRHNYQPGNPCDPKCVDNIDAIAWAAALSTGNRSPYLPAMLRATHRIDTDFPAALRICRHSDTFDATMKSFTQYAFGGAFAFSHTPQR